MRAHPLLQHRGVALLESTLLPALARDGWRAEASVAGVRLVSAGGDRPAAGDFLVAPSDDLARTLRALASRGAAAFLLVGPCAAPTARLEPGDLLVVERARDAAGAVLPNAPLLRKLGARCEQHGLRMERGGVATGVSPEPDEAWVDHTAAGVLRAGREARVPTAALLVCVGRDLGIAEAPIAVLDGFAGAFGVLRDVLGGMRAPSGPSAE